MKYYIASAVTIAVLVILGMPTQAQARDYWWLSAGKGGSLSATNLSAGVRGKSFGFQASFAFTSEYTYSENTNDGVLDYEVPHSDYSIEDENGNMGNAFGMSLFYFIDIYHRLDALVGFGGFYQGQCRVAQSNVTGWRYCQEEKIKTFGSITGGASFALSHNVTVEVRYSNASPLYSRR